MFKIRAHYVCGEEGGIVDGEGISCSTPVCVFRVCGGERGADDYIYVDVKKRGGTDRES